MIRQLLCKAARMRRTSGLQRAARVVAALFVVVGGLDVVSTDLALAAGHMEANPIVNTMKGQLGDWWGLPKVAIHLILAWFVLWLPSRRMLRLGGLVVAAYLLIVTNNLFLAAWSS